MLVERKLKENKWRTIVDRVSNLSKGHETSEKRCIGCVNGQVRLRNENGNGRKVVSFDDFSRGNDGVEVGCGSTCGIEDDAWRIAEVEASGDSRVDVVDVTLGVSLGGGSGTNFSIEGLGWARICVASLFGVPEIVGVGRDSSRIGSGSDGVTDVSEIGSVRDEASRRIEGGIGESSLVGGPGRTGRLE